MRVSTAFNRILQLPGAWVDTVEFTSDGIIVGLRRRRRRHLCPCGGHSGARHDLTRRRWRHLDMGRCAVWLEADIARIDCRRCGRAERLDPGRRELINALRRSRYGLWRAWDLKERLRDLYHRVDPTDAVRHLRA